MYFFTADEHYGHFGILKHCNRPFSGTHEMNEYLISANNAVVGGGDVVVHVGDFTLDRKEVAAEIISRLNGNHIFIRGNHDWWMNVNAKHIWHKNIEGQHVVACHYAMRVWDGSHHGSWQLYGHSHGTLPPVGLQYDVGVDNNNFTPVSFEQIKQIMKERMSCLKQ